MRAKAWNNGSHDPSGNGYGIKIEATDRDSYFNRTWKHVTLHLEGVGGFLDVNIDKPSFWGEICRELISKEIGQWLIKNERAPWPKGEPPKLELSPMVEGQFQVRFVEDAEAPDMKRIEP